jgi:hypothetical protein
VLAPSASVGGETPARPAARPAEERDEGGHEQGPDDERVDEDPRRDREGQLLERGEGDQRDQPEAGRERDAGDVDRPGGAGNRDRQGLGQGSAAGLLPDVADTEDVVVRAQRHQQDGGGEGDVEHDPVAAEQVLEHPGRQPERGGHGEDAGGEQVKRGDERPQEECQQQQVDEHDGDGDADEVVRRAVDQ